MSEQHGKVISQLKLYGIYSLQYTQTKPKPGTRTARAVFLGETKKQMDSELTVLVRKTDKANMSLTDRYLDVAFLAYRPGNGLPTSVPSIRYDVYTIYFCNPDGLKSVSENNVIPLPSDFRTKQFLDRPDTAYPELLLKLRRIAETTGLIDTKLSDISAKATGHLSTTKIRELHHGFTRMMERAKPDNP